MSFTAHFVACWIFTPPSYSVSYIPLAVNTVFLDDEEDAEDGVVADTETDRRATEAGEPEVVSGPGSGEGMITRRGPTSLIPVSEVVRVATARLTEAIFGAGGENVVSMLDT
jgi:hypothetical protein